MSLFHFSVNANNLNSLKDLEVTHFLPLFSWTIYFYGLVWKEQWIKPRCIIICIIRHHGKQPCIFKYFLKTEYLTTIQLHHPPFLMSPAPQFLPRSLSTVTLDNYVIIPLTSNMTSFGVHFVMYSCSYIWMSSHIRPYINSYE